MSNTVQLKINEMSNIIGEYIIKTSNGDFRAKDLSSFMLWGPPGVGKSESLQTISKMVEEKTNKKVVITDVRLLLFNPVDLRGIPVPNATKEFAIWLKPQIFQMDSSDDIINILMLDEISAAPPSVQAAAYQITLDRKVGEHTLPDNCYIICAGNRIQDKSVAYKMPKALANRLTHFDIYAELEDWKSWALQVGIDSRIIGFLNFKPSYLYNFDASSDDNAFPTPRTWAMANNYIKVFGSLEGAYNCIAGCIGIGVAGEFKRYCQVFTKIPNVQDIFDGKEVEMPTSPDILYALSAAISGRIHTTTKQQLRNVIKFTLKMNKEFSVLTMKDIMFVPKMKERLIMLEEWLTWSREHRNLIL